MTRDFRKGFFFVAVSAVTFGVAPMVAVFVYRGGCNTATLLFLRQTIACAIFLCFAGRRMIETLRVHAKKVVPLALLCSVATPGFLMASYLYISSGLATTLHFIYPMFVFLIEVAMRRARCAALKLLCYAACTVGVFLLNGGGGVLDLRGAVTALASGVVYAIYIVRLEHSGVSELDPFAVAGVFFGIAAVSLLVWCLATNSFTFSFDLWLWALIVVYSIGIGIGGTVFFQIGVRYIGGQRAALFSCLEPIVSVLCGAAFLRERFTAAALIGTVVIIVSITAAAVIDNRAVKA